MEEKTRQGEERGDEDGERAGGVEEWRKEGRGEEVRGGGEKQADQLTMNGYSGMNAAGILSMLDTGERRPSIYQDVGWGKKSESTVFKGTVT